MQTWAGESLQWWKVGFMFLRRWQKQVISQHPFGTFPLQKARVSSQSNLVPYVFCLDMRFIRCTSHFILDPKIPKVYKSKLKICMLLLVCFWFMSRWCFSHHFPIIDHPFSASFSAWRRQWWYRTQLRSAVQRWHGHGPWTVPQIVVMWAEMRKA